MANDFGAEITRDLWEAHALCARFRHAVNERGTSALSGSLSSFCLPVNPLDFPSLSSTLNTFPALFSKWKSYFRLALSNVQNSAFTFFLPGLNRSKSFPLLTQMSSVFCFWVFVRPGNLQLTKSSLPPHARARLLPSRAVFALRRIIIRCCIPLPYSTCHKKSGVEMKRQP